MADRTSAALFATMFEHLAGMRPFAPWDAKGTPQDITERDREFAQHLWKETRNYDFSYYQMGCDAALERLGLARRIPDPENPNYVNWIYSGQEEWK